MSSHGRLRKKPIARVCCVCGATYTETRYLTRATCGEACRRALIAMRRATQPDKRIVWHDVPCPICGRVVRQTGTEYHSGLRRTCSPACHSALMARNGAATLAMYGDAIEPARRAAYEASPLTARNSPDHNAAIEWRLIAPDGTRHHVRNLSALIRQVYGEDISARDLLRWQSGIGRIRPDRKAPKRQYKGWRWDD